MRSTAAASGTLMTLRSIYVKVIHLDKVAYWHAGPATSDAANLARDPRGPGKGVEVRYNFSKLGHIVRMISFGVETDSGRYPLTLCNKRINRPLSSDEIYLRDEVS